MQSQCTRLVLGVAVLAYLFDLSTNSQTFFEHLQITPDARLSCIGPSYYVTPRLVMSSCALFVFSSFTTHPRLPVTHSALLVSVRLLIHRDSKDIVRSISTLEDGIKDINYYTGTILAQLMGTRERVNHVHAATL